MNSKPFFFDAHTHLTRVGNLTPYLASRKKNGAAFFITASASPDDWPDILKLARTRGDILPAVGIHPWCVASLNDDQIANLLKRLENLLTAHPEIAAISECGIDTAHPAVPRQERTFIAQQKLAIKFQKPLVVHCHKAFHIFQRLLQNSAAKRIVFHGFNAGAGIQQWIVSNGYWISLGRNALRSNLVLNDALKNYAMFESDDDGMHETSIPDVIRCFPEIQPLNAAAYFGWLRRTK